MEEAYIIHLQLREAYKIFQEALSHVDMIDLKIKQVKATQSMGAYTRLCELACLRSAWDDMYKLACSQGEAIEDYKAELYVLTGQDESVYKYLSDCST